MRNPLQYAVKIFEFVREYATDLYLFMLHNSHSPVEENARKHFYHLIIKSHTIEKGLALPKPRPMFGREKITEILHHLAVYDQKYSELPIAMANGAFADYDNFNRALGVDDDETLAFIRAWLESDKASAVGKSGGIKVVSEFISSDSKAHSAFLSDRYSCRIFSPEPLPLDDISDAIQIAQKAPSQCNRQSVRLHFYQNPLQIQQLLSLQGGARGFDKTIGNLFVITSEITAWGGPQQRNQLYVDGGLYAMMLMLALQAKGIASCPLNLGVTNATEKKIKTTGHIPANQRVIMMLATGKAAKHEFNITKSPRLNVSEIVNFH